MLSPQQSPIRQYSSSKRLPSRPQSPKSPGNLPKITPRSPYDLKPQNHQDFNHRSSPLRKSHSMSLVLHGDPSTPTTYYIDELERFRRDHDVKNKEERERQKELMLQKLQQRRSLHIKRQQTNRTKQQQNLRYMIQKNTQILNAHQQGLIRNDTFNNSIPINPISLKYEQNIRGHSQKQIDNRAQARKLVRGHHLQTMGTSGYNIVNGETVNHTARLLEKNRDIEGIYEEKLNRFYEGLKIKPPSLEDGQKMSPRKPFKYH